MKIIDYPFMQNLCHSRGGAASFLTRVVVLGSAEALILHFNVLKIEHRMYLLNRISQWIYNDVALPIGDSTASLQGGWFDVAIDWDAGDLERIMCLVILVNTRCFDHLWSMNLRKYCATGRPTCTQQISCVPGMLRHGLANAWIVGACIELGIKEDK